MIEENNYRIHQIIAIITMNERTNERKKKIIIIEIINKLTTIQQISDQNEIIPSFVAQASMPDGRRYSAFAFSSNAAICLNLG